MPNHITNWVHIKGTKEKIAELRAKAIKDAPEELDCIIFDFNAVIPTPKDIFQGNLGQEEREKYGNNNWYDWNCTNWGTKWNAYSAKIEFEDETNLVVRFQTAWSPPTPIFEALEQQGFEVNVYWQDEDPSNEGTYGDPYDVFDINHEVTVEYMN